MNHKWRFISGLSLLELLITMAVAALLLSYAAPNLSRLVAASRQTATVNQLLGAVQMARTIAIARHKAVVLCPNDGHERCATQAQSWDFGYLIFVHDPPTRPYQVTDPAALVAVKSLPERIIVHANRNAFIFRPLSVRSSNGTFRVCDAALRVPPRAVIVSVTGRPRIAGRLSNGQPIPWPGADAN